MTPVIVALDLSKHSAYPAHPSPLLRNGVEFKKVEVALKEWKISFP